jgi:hypothetical protein
MRKFLLIMLFLIGSVNALEYTTIHITRSLNYDAQKARISQKTVKRRTETNVTNRQNHNGTRTTK